VLRSRATGDEGRSNCRAALRI